MKPTSSSGKLTLKQARAMTQQDETGLLVEVAKLYYEEQLTQAQIGRQLQTSRSTVSRLLKEARAKGVVKITIDYQWVRDSALERDLTETFDLEQAFVLRADGRTENEMIDGLGHLAARYLTGTVQDGMVLGVSYGRSIAATVRHVTGGTHDLTVLQVIGALGSGNPLQDGPDLARQLANTYGATYRYLHAPLLVESVETRDRLLQEPLVGDLLQTAKKADVVLMGVGPLTADASGLIFTGYLSKKDLGRLKTAGAVGHMCAQFFGADGELVDTLFNERAITIGLETLKTIPTVLTVAGGKEKAAALKGALNGGYIDVLVTDDEAARGVLEAG